MKATLEFNLDNLTEQTIRQIVREEIAKYMSGETDLPNEEYYSRMKQLLASPLDSLNLSVKTMNILKYCGEMTTLADLVSADEANIWKVRNCGRGVITEIRNKLDSLDLHFNTDVRKYGFTPHKWSKYYHEQTERL